MKCIEKRCYDILFTEYVKVKTHMLRKTTINFSEILNLQYNLYLSISALFLPLLCLLYGG